MRVHWQKISTASLKNSTDVSVPSVRFSQYVDPPSPLPPGHCVALFSGPIFLSDEGHDVRNGNIVLHARFNGPLFKKECPRDCLTD